MSSAPNMMHVALITDGIWPYVLGGMRKHSYYLCKFLAGSGHQVDLFHYNSSAYKIEDLEFFTPEEKANIRSILIDFPASFKFPGHYLYDNYLYSKAVYTAMAPHLSTYDFIYSKGFSAWYLIKLKHKGKINCAKIGVKFHGYEMFQTPPSFKVWLQHVLLLRAPVKWLSKQADVVFSYGGNITDIIKKLGVAPEKIIELPSGVETDCVVAAASVPDSPRKIVFLGRYERRKGIEELNIAMNGFLKSNHAAALDFTFIGPIPPVKQIQHNQVHYLGEIRNREHLLSILQNCDVLICPSWAEGMPNVILEGMASGLAIIASNVGATNLLVNESNGILLSAANSAEIETALQTIARYSNEELFAKKQAALSHLKAGYTWQTLRARLLTIITELSEKP